MIETQYIINTIEPKKAPNSAKAVNNKFNGVGSKDSSLDPTPNNNFSTVLIELPMMFYSV